MIKNRIFLIIVVIFYFFVLQKMLKNKAIGMERYWIRQSRRAKNNRKYSSSYITEIFSFSLYSVLKANNENRMEVFRFSFQLTFFLATFIILKKKWHIYLVFLLFAYLFLYRFLQPFSFCLIVYLCITYVYTSELFLLVEIWIKQINIWLVIKTVQNYQKNIWQQLFYCCYCFFLIYFTPCQ